MFLPTASALPFRLLATDYRQYASLPYLCLLICLPAFLLLRPRSLHGRIARSEKAERRGQVRPGSRRVAGPTRRDSSRTWTADTTFAAGLIPAAQAPRFRTAILGALFLYLAISSILMNRVWRDEESLWGQSVRYGASTTAHYNYAIAVMGKDEELAELHLQESLRLYPTNVRAHISLGLLRMRQGRTDEGLAKTRHALELAPHWALTHYWHSRTLSMAGRKEEAARESARAAEMEPRNPQFTHQAAFDAQRQGDYEASLQFLEDLHKVSRSYRRSRFLEGLALQKLGRHEEALAPYRTYLEEDPSRYQARFNLAYSLMKTGRYEEAIADFRRVLELKPDYHEVHYHLGTCYRELGKVELARKHREIYNKRMRE
jgi:Flp pilus assembly protein TadD